MAGSTLRRRGPAFVTAVVLTAGLGWLACTGEQTAPTSTELPDAIVQQGLKPAIDVQLRHADRLMSTPGVVGTGVGLTRAGSPRIVVYITESDGARLPRDLEGVPVDVEVSGRFYALSDPTSRFPRPVPIGVSTGHPDITAGTIGAAVKDSQNRRFALSNNHVYANQNAASIGDPGLQPGAFDGGTAPADQIGTLYDYEPIQFGSLFSAPINVMDAAIVLSSPDQLDTATPEDGYGTPGTSVATAFVGQAVQKFGRTTKLTQGTVSAVSMTVDVCYDQSCSRWARFGSQIAIGTAGFSDGGDSGSLIVTADANLDPVGLLFAGSSTTTIANPIGPVFDRFGVSIDDGPATPPAPGPDLAITQVDAPDAASQGDVVSVDITVENVGDQDAGGDIEVTLRDETDGVVVGTQTIAGGLAAGGSTVLSYSWATESASIGVHTLEANHDFTDGNTSNDTRTTSVDVQPPPGSGVHMGDLWPFASREGSTWTAYVIVTVHDAAHNPVEGATVTGSWDVGFVVDQCTTDYAGECLVLSTFIGRRYKSATFTVTDVTYGSLAYESAANHDPDGDSDGTSITVSRP